MKIFVYSLLFSLLFSTGARLRVCVNYLINQKYYAEVLCKNKAVKNSCCKGKCAVEKELTDLEKKEDPGTNSPVLKIGKVEEALCSSHDFHLFDQAFTLISTPFIFHPGEGYENGLIKPPLI